MVHRTGESSLGVHVSRANLQKFSYTHSHAALASVETTHRLIDTPQSIAGLQKMPDEIDESSLGVIVSKANLQKLPCPYAQTALASVGTAYRFTETPKSIAGCQQMPEWTNGSFFGVLVTRVPLQKTEVQFLSENRDSIF